MNIISKYVGLGLILCLVTTLNAQQPDNFVTESGEILEVEENSQNEVAVLDDIVETTITYQRQQLKYDHIREADIFYKKRVWRIIDVREKMNLPFAYPNRPLVKILLESVRSGEIVGYSDEKFDNPIDTSVVKDIGAEVDSIETFNPQTYEPEIKVIRNELDLNSVKRFRVKEDWFFDKESSTLQVRILGIAPVLPIRADGGDVIGESPMFWVYYPEARKALAKERYYNPYNDASTMSWEDLFEMRFFSSYIYKMSNVQDLRIEDYIDDPIDQLIEAENLERQIFNFEHDLWSY